MVNWPVGGPAKRAGYRNIPGFRSIATGGLRLFSLMVFLESEASMLTAEADLLRAEYDRSVAAAELARLTGNH